MPVRAIQISLENGTQYPLTKAFEHLCGGSWRPTGSPPATIAPGQTGLIRAESDGVATGTEGYVKYAFQPGPGIDDAGRPVSPCTVYLYWTNPFFGVTKIKRQVSKRDVLPDCDFDAPDTSGEFQAVDDPGYYLAVSGPHAGPGADSWTELAAAAVTTGGFPVQPIWLIGRAGIFADAFAEVRLQPGARPASAPMPAFLPLGETRFAPLTGVSATFWQERWDASAPDGSGRYIRVDLSRQSDGLHASVDERVLTTPFQTKATRLSPVTGLSRSSDGDQWTPVPIANVAQAHVQQGPHPHAQALAAAHQAHRSELTAVLRRPLVDRIYVTDECIIESYGEFENERLVAPRLRYLRWSRGFKSICDVLLKRRPDIR